MKRILLPIILVAITTMASYAQMGAPRIEGEEVYSGEDVVFHKIDDHTWIGSGKVMSNESLYLVEGEKLSVLIDAGTTIKDLDKIVASITDKPVMLVATHVHPDHTGSAINYWSEIYLNQADTVNIPAMMGNYKGEVKYLKEGQIIDLGGRKLEVLFTPGHTPGSTTFIDKENKIAFSGDAFGSGNLLLTTDFSTLLSTCEKTSKIMEKYGLESLYPGHFFGMNKETKQRVDDMATICRDVLSGELKGEENPNGMMGLNMIITKYGVRINYSERALK